MDLDDVRGDTLKILDLKEPTLPPIPQPRNRRVELTHDPRPMYPVHGYGINNNKNSPYYGQSWQLDLIMVPMESVRETFPIRFRGTSKALRNLQTWVNNLGPALYNPIWWKVVDNPELSPSKRLNAHMRKVHGSHRVRTLEALDFPFIYVYLQTGAIPRLPQYLTEMRGRNAMSPTMSRHTGYCSECNSRISWGRGYEMIDGEPKRFYTCKKCDHSGYGPVFYPEPV